MAVSLFTVVPVRLYELSVTLQASLTAGITGYGTSIGEVATEIVDTLSGVDSLTGMTSGSYFGFASITSPIMLLFCIILMAYAVIKVFFANLKRGGILLIQIAVGSLYMFSVPRGYTDGFIQWCKQIIGLCLTAFLQSTILIAGLMVFKDNALLGLGLMLSAGEIPPYRRSLWPGYHHKSQHHVCGLHRPGRSLHHKNHRSGGSQMRTNSMGPRTSPIPRLVWGEEAAERVNFRVRTEMNDAKLAPTMGACLTGSGDSRWPPFTTASFLCGPARSKHSR